MLELCQVQKTQSSAGLQSKPGYPLSKERKQESKEEKDIKWQKEEKKDRERERLKGLLLCCNDYFESLCLRNRPLFKVELRAGYWQQKEWWPRWCVILPVAVTLHHFKRSYGYIYFYSNHSHSSSYFTITICLYSRSIIVAVHHFHISFKINDNILARKSGYYWSQIHCRYLTQKSHF